MNTPTASHGVAAMASVRVVKQADLDRPVIPSASLNASGTISTRPTASNRLRQRHLGVQVLARPAAHADRNDSQRRGAHGRRCGVAQAKCVEIVFTRTSLPGL